MQPLTRPQAMRVAPAANHTTSFGHIAANTGAPSAPGVHDTLRAGVGPRLSTSQTSSVPDSTHPLENRLKNWQATQDAMKMEGLRRTFGMAEPIRRGMELKIVRDGEWRPAMLGGPSGVHEDILAGRDNTCSWEDIYKGDEMRSVPGFHEEVEKKVRMAQ